MTPLRMGLLGAARIAPTALIAPAARRSDVVVVGVAARSQERAYHFAQQHSLERAYRHYQELLDDPEIDAVYLALPASLHATFGIAALRAGKHVLCEKPLACNAHEARAMFSAAQAHRRLLVEAFHDSYHPFFHELLKLCRQHLDLSRGRLHARFDAPIGDAQDIRRQLELGGGALMDLGCYPVRWLRQITQLEPTVVNAQAQTCSVGVDESLSAELCFSNGAVARMQCSMAADCAFGGQIMASDGTTTILASNPIVAHTGNLIRILGIGQASSHSVPGGPTYDYQLEAFLGAIRGQFPAYPSPADSIANLEAMDAIYRATGLGLRGQL